MLNSIYFPWWVRNWTFLQWSLLRSLNTSLSISSTSSRSFGAAEAKRCIFYFYHHQPYELCESASSIWRNGGNQSQASPALAAPKAENLKWPLLCLENGARFISLSFNMIALYESVFPNCFVMRSKARRHEEGMRHDGAAFSKASSFSSHSFLQSHLTQIYHD